MRRTQATRVVFWVLVVGGLFLGTVARAQSPELSLREFASGQIKKGVRVIGFGGDGATWGNYALLYNDAGGALIDYGITSYTNGNTFTFTALGFTSPQLWHGLVFYALALSQHASDINLSLNPDGSGATSFIHGTCSNQSVFVKAAMPLGGGWSVGALLSYELSFFDAVSETGDIPIHYETQWRPSGGFGVTWQPMPRLLFGSRIILNHDWEIRRDAVDVRAGMATSYEVRLGGSAALWRGALIDAGGTLLDKSNAISGKHTLTLEPNLGFEQSFFDGRWALRAGIDETSYGAGTTVRFGKVKLDVAYVYGLGSARVGTLFGTASHSVLATVTYDYRPPL